MPAFAVPPFWLAPTGTDGQRIDPRVEEAAREVWPYCWAESSKLLADPATAADIVDSVAAAVSRSLAENPDVGRNLTGYFVKSFQRRVRWLAYREGRIRCVGLGRDLEASLFCPASDWLSQLEARIFLEQLMRSASPVVRGMLAARLTEWTWSEIAAHHGLSVNQAKSQFYHGLHGAYERSLMRNGSEEDHDA